MKIRKKTFGVLSNGKRIKIYTLEAGDLRFSLTNYGATWTSLLVPSRKNGKADVLLGYSGFDGYLNNKSYIGVTAGRYANRIKNARFAIKDKVYNLEKNDGENSLNSGFHGFDKKVWKAETYEDKSGVFVRFELDSPDMGQGFPGKLNAVVCYGLTDSNEIIASYEASVTAPTPVNITNLAYFNLAREGTPNIFSHELLLHSTSYVETNEHGIPSGRLLPVKNTDFDFSTRKKINSSFDQCYVIEGEMGTLRACAEVFEPVTGRHMKVFTTHPGVQFNTGNKLNGINGKHGSCYSENSGFKLVTQYFPDSPNNKEFPSCIFEPGKSYQEKSVFSFGW